MDLNTTPGNPRTTCTCIVSHPMASPRLTTQGPRYRPRIKLLGKAAKVRTRCQEARTGFNLGQTGASAPTRQGPPHVHHPKWKCRQERQSSTRERGRASRTGLAKHPRRLVRQVRGCGRLGEAGTICRYHRKGIQRGIVGVFDNVGFASHLPCAT